MYVLEPWKKQNPTVRWRLPDRIFFGHGACHILAGVFLQDKIDTSFEAYWLRPDRHPGNHVFVSDGQVAFDHHGYSALDRLLQHHRKVWQRQHADWSASIVPVDFDLLSTGELNERNMRGPDQYLGDPVRRARAFIRRVDHSRAKSRARSPAVVSARAKF